MPWHSTRTSGHTRIGIVGLGYVGLPLAGKQQALSCCGFRHQSGSDRRASQGARQVELEVEPADLAAANGLQFAEDSAALAECNFYIVTVPTPINAHKEPDLGPLESASRLLGDVVKLGDVVVYESTVYPGATEEVCIPIIERVSGLRYNLDFFAGYSPERIDPGDKEHRLQPIVKVASG